MYNVQLVYNWQKHKQLTAVNSSRSLPSQPQLQYNKIPIWEIHITESKHLSWTKYCCKFLLTLEKENVIILVGSPQTIHSSQEIHNPLSLLVSPDSATNFSKDTSSDLRTRCHSCTATRMERESMFLKGTRKYFGTGRMFRTRHHLLNLQQEETKYKYPSKEAHD